MNDNELYAKALVDGGYAKKIKYSDDRGRFDKPIIQTDLKNCYSSQFVDPFAKTREGYEQAFALEDWLMQSYIELWTDSVHEIDTPYHPMHQWRLSRIKWCFSQPEIAEALK